MEFRFKASSAFLQFFKAKEQVFFNQGIGLWLFREYDLKERDF